MISTKTPATLVDEYVEEVLAGEGIGRYERLAVDRYLDDRKNAHKRGFHFNSEWASQAVEFFPAYLRHWKGRWAGSPLYLEPFQAFWIWQLWGWRIPDEGHIRRFRKFYELIGRKNGKTATCAGAACLDTFYGHRPGAIESGGEVYCCATKKPQAALLWRDIVAYIEASPELKELAYIKGRLNESGGTVHLQGAPWNGTTIKTIGADAKRQDGLGPSFTGRDEIHEWQPSHRALMDKMATGSDARISPLEWTITTAGSDASLLWIEEHAYAEHVLDAFAGGQADVNDRMLVAIYQVDKDDDPFDESCWRKGNPALDRFKSRQGMRDLAREAALKSSALAALKRYHLGVRTSAYETMYPADLWATGNQAFDMPEDGSLCFAGVDLGKSDDWSALVFVFPELVADDPDEEHPELNFRFKVLAYCFACQGTPRCETQVPWSEDPFATWVKEERIHWTHDEVMDYGPLAAKILDFHERYQLQQVAYDKQFAHETMNSLFNDHGVAVAKFEQSYRNYNEPIRSLERALGKGRIIHGGNDVLAWQVANTCVKEGPMSMRMPAKGGEHWQKIDATVAMLMAYGAAIHSPMETGSGPGVMAI